MVVKQMVSRNPKMALRKDYWWLSLILTLAVTFFSCSRQRGINTSSTSNVAPKEKPSTSPLPQLPSARRMSNGNYEITLLAQQQSAVDEFLREHNDVVIPTLRKEDLSDPGRNNERDKLFRSGKMQHPFACWGDLNKDGIQDFAMVFVSTNAVNEYDWHDWWIVVFQGNSSGKYDPQVVSKEQAGCFSWLLYNQKTNHVRFECLEVAAGEFYWDGKRYVVRHLMGD